MKKLIGVLVILSVMLAVGIVFVVGAETGSSQGKTVTTPPKTVTPAKPLGPCCIAGKYEGSRKDNLPATKTCPKPGSGKFSMEIMQDTACGSKIWGTITDLKDGTKQKFEGKVTVKDKCCYIEGVMKKPAATAAAASVEETKFQGTLCKKDGKFVGSGEYATFKGTLPGCKGKWEMQQL
jgi:hypothetical protein